MRRGASAVEILLAAALWAGVALSLGDLLQVSHRITHEDRALVAAQRRAQRTLALIEGHPLETLLERAVGGPPPAMDPPLSEDSRELYLPAFVDRTLPGLPPEELSRSLRADAIRSVRLYLEELRPGFARATVVVTWQTTPRSPLRHLVRSEFLEDPFHWSHP